MPPPTVPGVPAHASRPAHAVADRPSYQSVDRHRRIRANARRRRSSTTSPPRGLMTSPRTPASDTSTFDPPPSIVTGTPASDASFSAVTISSLVLGSTSQSAGPPTRNVVSGASGTSRRARSPNCLLERPGEVEIVDLPSAWARLERHQRLFLSDQRGHRLSQRTRPRRKSNRPGRVGPRDRCRR